MGQSASLDDELRNVVDHAQTLLEALAGGGDAELSRLCERVAASIDSAKARLEDLATDAERASERAADTVERWIREHPFTAVAIGAGAGLVAGWLLSSRRGRTAPAGADRS